MEPDPLHKALQDQFKRALHMFRRGIRATPEAEWRLGNTPDRRPSGLAYHLLETIAFYTGELPSEQFPWGQRFGVDWECEDPSRLPSRAQVQDYLLEVEGALDHWLSAADFRSPETLFKWTGRTVLERALYLLRHTQHHVGELSRELDVRGYAGMEWR